MSNKIFGVFVIVGFNRWRWRRKFSDAANYDPARPVARLIAAPLLVQFINIASIFGVALMANILFDTFDNVDDLFGWSNPVPLVTIGLAAFNVDPLQDFIQHISRSTLIFTGFLIILITFFLTPIQAGLGLLVDVTNHFRLGKSPLMRDVKEYGWASGLKRAMLPARTDFFPLRARIVDRIQTVTEDLIVSEQITKLTIVAHSQGSVFALQAIRQNPDLLQGRPVQLVTMGSPYTHLFEHYFPGRYGMENMTKRPPVDRWINIFRTNDFVGTEITGADNYPQNFPVAPRGHTGYWRDAEVLAIIRKEAEL